MRIKFILILAALIFCGCAQPPQLDEDRIKKSVLAVMHESVAGWNAGNIEKFMASYWPSDSLRFVSNGSVRYGWQPVLERYKKSYPGKEGMGALTFSEMDVAVLSADAAVVFGKYLVEREQEELTGYFTLLFKRMNGDWKIVHDHTSSDG